MQTSLQRSLDKVILLPFKWLLNQILRVFVILRPPRNIASSDIKTVAVFKYKGLGSIIQSTVVLQNIRKTYPQAKLIYVSTKQNHGLLSQIKIIDETLLLDDNDVWSLLRRIVPFLFLLRNKKIDLAFDLELYSNFSSLILGLSRARQRLGFYHNGTKPTQGIYTQIQFFDQHTDITTVYNNLFAKTSHNPDVKSLYPFALNQVDIQNTLTQHGLQVGSYICVNVNASDLRIERRWPSTYFVAFINQFIQQYPNYSIVLIGTKQEHTYTSSVQNQTDAPEKLLVLAGKTSITSLLHILKGSKLLLTNDTGPMHMAAALKTPCVALFGPCHPVQYQSQIVGEILYQRMPCSPCVHLSVTPPCKGDNQCMKQISPNSVFSAVERVMTTVY
jgi:ADP-heptose:LPS heptosyltransferase